MDCFSRLSSGARLIYICALLPAPLLIMSTAFP